MTVLACRKSESTFFRRYSNKQHCLPLTANYNPKSSQSFIFYNRMYNSLEWGKIQGCSRESSENLCDLKKDLSGSATGRSTSVQVCATGKWRERVKLLKKQNCTAKAIRKLMIFSSRRRNLSGIWTNIKTMLMPKHLNS